MPHNLTGLVAETASSGCTVVVSSRVSRVTVLAETMTSVKSKNVFPSGLLNPQKSALLLSLALDANLDALELAELFNVFVTQ
jgi:L-asparaginase/Glu-tRNA(Gln) amidotransferase subunit D